MTVPKENRAYIVIAEIEMHFPDMTVAPWVPTQKKWLVRAETMHHATEYIKKLIIHDTELRLVNMMGIPDQFDMTSTVIDIT